MDCRIRARLVEALDYLRGEPPPGYPSWMPSVAKTLIRLLPQILCAPAIGHPSEFLEGIRTAFVLQAFDRLQSLPSKDLGRFNRLARSVLRSATRSQIGIHGPIERALAKFDIRTAFIAAADDVAGRMSLTAPAREAFFQGFALGLKPVPELEALVAGIRTSLGAKKRNGRNAVRLFLLLNWPEVESARGRIDVYRMCRHAFAHDPSAVGSASTFLSFLKREGIRRRAATKQDQG